MYQIIYADPPWEYRDKALSGNRGACCKYSTMNQAQIRSLPVDQIAARDCCLFMWVTMPKLDECWPILAAWGFTYKTVAFTWIKTNKRADTLFWGMGRWTRANAELCLLATRGSPKRCSARVHSIIKSPIEAHSKKPDEVKSRIVSLCGDLPRVELFARNSTPGWHTWGNECDLSLFQATVGNAWPAPESKQFLSLKQPTPGLAPARKDQKQ